MPQNQFWNLLAKKLSGEALASDLAELEQLMKEHPDWIYAAEHLENIWKLETMEEDGYDSELAFTVHLEHQKKNGLYLPELNTPLSIETGEASLTKIKKRRYGLLSILAIGLVVICGFIWKYNSHSPVMLLSKKGFSEVSTKPGSKTKMILPDSTVVWLNAGTRLSYDDQFGISNRNTTLTGEAFFDVKKTSIPFIIHAKSIQIKVMGTAFNVKSYPNEKTTETSLIRGRVEITIDKRPGEKFILKPNEKLVVANEPELHAAVLEKKEPIVVLSDLTHLNDSTIIETSWVENKLAFQDESFFDLAKKMERWYGVSISIRDDKTGSHHLTGTFATETIQEALEELQMVVPFHFTIKSNSITIAK